MCGNAPHLPCFRRQATDGVFYTQKYRHFPSLNAKREMQNYDKCDVFDPVDPETEPTREAMIVVLSPRVVQ